MKQTSVSRSVPLSAARVTRRAVLASALAVPYLAGAVAAEGGRLQVIATTGMIGDTAARIGGDAVDVRALMGPGVDPHAYRQTRTDVAAMARADVVLWHGLYLEAQMEAFFAKLARRGVVRPVGEAVPRELLISHADYENRFDPHVWMDPALWTFVAEDIRDTLSAARPEAAALFAGNAARFVEELAALGQYAAQRLSSVPESARVLVTAHDAFGYFGRAHGFQVEGIQGISTESEAGLVRIRALVDLLVERQIGAVFVESSVSDRNVRALIEGAAARGHAVRVGGELFSDAMGPGGTYEGTYLGMIDHNVTTIAQALGGQAPQGGRLGLLSAGG